MLAFLLAAPIALLAQRHSVSLSGHYANYDAFPVLKDYNMTGPGLSLAYDYQFYHRWSAGLSADVNFMSNDIEFTDELGNPYDVHYTLGSLKPVLKYAIVQRTRHQLSAGVSAGWSIFSTKVDGLPVEAGFEGFDDENGGNAGLLAAYQYHLKNGWSLLAKTNLEWLWIGSGNDDPKRLFTAGLGVAKSL